MLKKGFLSSLIYESICCRKQWWLMVVKIMVRYFGARIQKCSIHLVIHIVWPLNQHFFCICTRLLLQIKFIKYRLTFATWLFLAIHSWEKRKSTTIAPAQDQISAPFKLQDDVVKMSFPDQNILLHKVRKAPGDIMLPDYSLFEKKVVSLYRPGKNQNKILQKKLICSEIWHHFLKK